MVITMKILAFVLPISVPCLTFFHLNKYYKMQKKVFEKITPKSVDDEIKLMLTGLIGSFALWCFLFVFFSLIESICAK